MSNIWMPSGLQLAEGPLIYLGKRKFHQTPADPPVAETGSQVS